MVLGKRETICLKGLAILMIVMHNVAHCLVDVRENEFSFSFDRVVKFINDFATHPLVDLFSFFGWLGVSVFVFISGYGLAAKYERADFKSVPWILNHYAKLLLLSIPALIAVILFIYDFPSNPRGLTHFYFVNQSLLLNIVAPSRLCVGIYWYLGLALQLYVIFPFIRKLSTKVLLGILIADIVFLAFCSDEVLDYCRMNFVGWLPEYLFGIFCFRMKDINMKTKNLYLTAVSMLILVVLLSYTRYTFFLSGVCFVCFVLALRRLICKIPGMHWVGIISASLYVVHAVVRNYCLERVIPHYRLSTLEWMFITLGVSIVIAIPYNWYYRRALRWLKKLSKRFKFLAE